MKGLPRKLRGTCPDVDLKGAFNTETQENDLTMKLYGHALFMSVKFGQWGEREMRRVEDALISPTSVYEDTNRNLVYFGGLHDDTLMGVKYNRISHYAFTFRNEDADSLNPEFPSDCGTDRFVRRVYPRIAGGKS